MVARVGPAVIACLAACTRTAAAPDLTCGAGTHDDGSGTCIPDGPSHYEIHAASTITADGHSHSEVLVFGSNPDGTPAHDQVVLGADRPGTGEYVSPTFTLDDLGGQTDFIPCNSTIAGCTGPVSLTLALASAPTERVAHVDVLLVPPAGVGSIAHCMTGGNVMYLDGNDGVYTGMLTVVDAGWSSIGGTQRAVIEVTPTNPVQGTSWGLTFETRQLMIAMAPSVYEDAEQAPSEPPGHAGISINGTGSTCDYATGRFQIEEFTLGTNNDVKTLTASFEQYCTPADLTRVLTGCVHYAQ